MRLIVNLRHLQAHNISLEGELTKAELDIDTRDEVIEVGGPLRYALEVQKLEDSLLVQGRMRLTLACKCVRCLKAFEYPLEFKAWTCLLPLKGEESIAAVNDCVDLTAQVREDILLEFPQHPLCDPECRGLPNTTLDAPMKPDRPDQSEAGSSAWAELNKLKF